MTGTQSCIQTQQGLKFSSKNNHHQKRFMTGLEELLKSKAADRLYRLENGLALDLDELSVGNMVIPDHDEIDEHGFPFSVAQVEHIYNKPSEEKFGQIRVCYHTVHFKRGQRQKNKR